MSLCVWDFPEYLCGEGMSVTSVGQKFRLPTRNLQSALGQGASGGVIAQRGFNFQVHYTCYRLTDLLFKRGVEGMPPAETVRIEGVEDLDVRYVGNPLEPDGWIEEYFQVKHRPSMCWTWNEFKKILERFQADWAAVNRHPSTRFRIVVSGMSLPRGCGLLVKPRDARFEKYPGSLESFQNALLNLVLLEHRNEDPAPRPRVLKDECKLDGEDTDFLSYETSFEAHTKGRLASWGIPHSRCQDAYNAMRVAVHTAAGELSSARTFTFDSLSELLGKFVVDEIPGCKRIDKAFFENCCRASQAVYHAEGWETLPFMGNEATWGDIACDRDVMRSCFEDVVKVVEELAASQAVSMLLITGDPGEGKSALAMRLGRYFVEHKTAIALELEDPLTFRTQNGAGFLKARCKRAKSPVIMLCGDLFEDDNWKYVLRPLRAANSDGSSVVLIVTSLDADPIGLRSEFDVVKKYPLKGVDESEIQAIGERFSLKPSQVQTLSRESFLVAMVEACSGFPIERAMERFCNNLANRSPDCVGVFTYLSLAGRLGLDVPLSLLEKILPASRKMLEYPEESGLGRLVKKTQTREAVRFGPAHRRIAEEFLKVRLKRVPQYDDYEAFIERSSPDTWAHRQFVARLFLHLARASEVEVCKKLVWMLRRLHEGWWETGGVIEFGRQWPEVFRRLNEKEFADAIKSRAASATPRSSGEAVYQADLLLNMPTPSSHQERRKNAVSLLRSWLDNNLKDEHVLSKYLGLLAQTGGVDRRPEASEWEPRQRALDQAAAWLESSGDRPTAHSVFVSYLTLLDKWASSHQRIEGFKRTIRWIKDRRTAKEPMAIPVVEKWISAQDAWRQKAPQHELMKRVRWLGDGGWGLPLKEILQVCNEQVRWWNENPISSYVLREADAWLAEVDLNDSLLAPTLRFATRWGGENDRARLVSAALEVLRTRAALKHPMERDQEIWLTAAGSTAGLGDFHEAKQWFALTVARLNTIQSGFFQAACLVSTMRLIWAHAPQSWYPKLTDILSCMTVGDPIDSESWRALAEILETSAITSPPGLVHTEAVSGEASSLLARMPANVLQNVDLDMLRERCTQFRSPLPRLNVAIMAAKVGVTWAENELAGLAFTHIRGRFPAYEYAKFLCSREKWEEARKLLEGLLGVRGDERVRPNPGNGAYHRYYARVLEAKGESERAALHQAVAGALRDLGPRRNLKVADDEQEGS